MEFGRKIAIAALAGALFASGTLGWKWTTSASPAKAAPPAQIQPDGWSWGGGE